MGRLLGFDNCDLVLLGYEVDKFFKILIKTSNASKFIKSDIQNIEAPITKDPII